MPITSFFAVGILLYFFGFLNYYPNRIAQSRSLFLPNINTLFFFFAESLVLLSAILNLIYDNIRQYVNILSAMLIIALCLYAAGEYARYAYISNHIARVSFGLGFWLSLFFVYVIVIDAVKESNIYYKIVVSISFLLLFAIFIASGHLDKIDIAREFYSRKTRFANEISTHLYLSFASVSVASILSFPLGIIAYKNRKTTHKIFTILNILQTIPSIAMFGALILPLAYLSKHSKFLSSIGVAGIGYAPAFIALILYAMLPIVRNVYSGLNSVPQSVREASIGMGMNRIQLLFKVELALAITEILTGLKISLVQTIGNAALAALIGAGGLGVFIFQGLGEASNSLIMLGVLPLVFIAVFSEYIMNVIILFVSKKIYRYD